MAYMLTMTPSAENVPISKHNNLWLDKDTNKLYNNDELIVSLRYGSANYRLLCYLFDNSNREVTEEELESTVFKGQSIYLKKLIANTKLPDDIRKGAFTAKHKSVIFNPSF